MGKNMGSNDWDWEDLDWLKEMPLDDEPAEQPQPAPKRTQQPRQQRPASPSPQTQQRPVQRRTASQSYDQQPAPRRTVQQQPTQRRAASQSYDQQPAQRQAPRQASRQQYDGYDGYDRPRQQRPASRPPQAQQPQRRPAPQSYDRQPVPRQASRQQYDGYDQPRQRPARRQSRPEESWRDEGYREVSVEPDDYRPRRRGFQKQNIPLIILVVLLVGGVLFAGGKLGGMLLNYHRDRSAYNSLADEATSGLAEPNTTTEPGATPDPNQNQTASEVPFGVNWDYLKGVNSDVVGWLFCADTNINYPVVQTSDNDFYLHRGFDRQPNTAGALFADYNAALGIPNSNFIIYGHNMKDGSMFATVEKYLDPSFYDQHPYMYLMTPTQNYRVELISAHIVESTMNNYPGYFSYEGEYQQYLNEITSRSAFATRSSVTTGYQLITLSTCDYSGGYNDPRCLLHGLLVPIT